MSRPPARPGKHTGQKIGRTLIALLSVLVLAATGYAYNTYEIVNGSLRRADVIDPGAYASGAQNILLVGMDSRTDVNGNPLPAAELAALNAGGDDGEVNTDTLIIMHISADGSQVTGVSIPRDSWVKIPGYGSNKINSAFAAAKDEAMSKLASKGETGPQAEVDSDASGAQELIKTVEQLTGITITHYAAVNLFGFFEISNAIGGVPVCLKQAVNDPYSGAHFPAGHFTVQGADALAFVRQRHNIPGGSTDLEREQRQQAFLSSMAHKILSAGTLTNRSTFNALIGAVQKAVTIDQNWDLTSFASQMAGINSGAIKFTTIPTTNIDYTPPGYSNMSAIQVTPSAVQAFFAKITGSGNADLSTGGSSTGSSDTATANSNNSATTVDVWNASGQTGLAALVLKDLTNEGFNAGNASNASSRSASVVYYRAGEQTAGQRVDNALGGGLTLEEGSSVPSGHVWVYLGRGYSGPGAEGITGASHVILDGGLYQAHSTTTTSTAPAAPSSSSNTIADTGTTPCVN